MRKVEAYWHLIKICVVSVPSQTDENKLIKNRIGIHSGVCIHNGIVHKNRDEWTVDDCTECTCQVRSPECVLSLPKYLNTRVRGCTLYSDLFIHAHTHSNGKTTRAHTYTHTLDTTQLIWSVISGVKAWQKLNGSLYCCNERSADRSST